MGRIMPKEYRRDKVLGYFFATLGCKGCPRHGGGHRACVIKNFSAEVKMLGKINGC